MSYFASKRQDHVVREIVILAAAGLVSALTLAQPAAAQTNDFAAKPFVAPTVSRQPNRSAASIQSTVDQFRAALEQ